MPAGGTTVHVSAATANWNAPTAAGSGSSSGTTVNASVASAAWAAPAARVGTLVNVSQVRAVWATGAPVVFVIGYSVWHEETRNTTWTEEARMPTWTEEARGVAWSAPTMTILVKRASEVRVYTMDLSNLPEIVAGDTVAAVSSVTATAETPGAAALTIAGIAVASGNKGAKATISGGTDGAQYIVSFTVTTAGGATLVGIGYLAINDR